MFPKKKYIWSSQRPSWNWKMRTVHSSNLNLLCLNLREKSQKHEYKLIREIQLFWNELSK